MRDIGFHLRITKDLTTLGRYACKIGIPIFQCFFLHQRTKRHYFFSQEDQHEFLKLRMNFKQLYVHGAYWINLCDPRISYISSLLKKELHLAKQLQFTHYVIHPGSSKHFDDRQKGIAALAKILNTVLKDEDAIHIVIENAAQGKHSIGGSLEDLETIKNLVEYPEKIEFCIDTAHAHSYGYDIIKPQSRELFLDELQKKIGLDRIALIHLNDSQEQSGVQYDRHDVIGHGTIGETPLREFILDKRIAHIPIIMEMPPLNYSGHQKLLTQIKQWHNQKK